MMLHDTSHVWKSKVQFSGFQTGHKDMTLDCVIDLKYDNMAKVMHKNAYDLHLSDWQPFVNVCRLG